MRVTWLEALCVLAIALATLHLQPGEREARLFTLPSLAALKSAIVADNTPKRLAGGPERIR